MPEYRIGENKPQSYISNILTNGYPEISPNNRAGCKETVCKKEGDKITKGSLRWGSWVEIESMGRASWSWKHWFVIPLALRSLVLLLTFWHL